jgi:hypothetical protein
MKSSFKKTFFMLAIMIAVALCGLLVLASQQYRLYGQHEKTINQIEKLIFKYAIIREQIIDSFADNDYKQLSKISGSFEDFQNNITNILDNSLIPVHYKLSFLQQIDLPGVILLLRKVQSEDISKSQLREINQETRIIGERLMLFERLVLGYAKKKLVGFQAIVIGILALIVFLVTTLLIVAYKWLILPLVNLNEQLDNIKAGKQADLYNPGGWSEVNDLSLHVDAVLRQTLTIQEQLKRYVNVMESCRKFLMAIQHSGTKEELCQEACKSLLSNPDYILAWIGERDNEEESLMPIAADGSTTMSGDECKECMAVLLATGNDTNEVSDPSWQAFVQGEAVLRADILAGVPKGPFKNTPLVNGKIDCLSLPLLYNDDRYGAMSVYIMGNNGINEVEISLLAEMAKTLAFRMAMFGCGGDGRLRESLSQNSQVAIATAIGEFAPSLAHEITDLNNGIINYAQMVIDDLNGNDFADSKHLLKNVISGGERVASIIEILASDRYGSEFLKSLENLHKVVNGVLSLTSYQLKKEGITVSFDNQLSSSIMCPGYPVQLLLIVLMNYAVKYLNYFYNHGRPDKYINLVAAPEKNKMKNMINLVMEFKGEPDGLVDQSAAMDVEAFHQRHATSILIGKGLAHQLGGEIIFDDFTEKKPSIKLVLPVS